MSRIIHLNRIHTSIPLRTSIPALSKQSWQMPLRRSSSSLRLAQSSPSRLKSGSFLLRRHLTDKSQSKIIDNPQNIDMSNSSNTPMKATTPSTKPDLNLDTGIGVGVWEGKAVFSKEPFSTRSIRENSPKTPRNLNAASSGTSTSPISISSSSPSPSPSPRTLPRPRAVPQYTSPLPRTTFTPSRSNTVPIESTSSQNFTSTSSGKLADKPIHPFFNRTRTAPPTSQPRYTAHYSSTEASSTQSSQTQSESQASQSTTSSDRSPSALSTRQQGHKDKDKELDWLAEEVEKLNFYPSKTITKTSVEAKPTRLLTSSQSTNVKPKEMETETNVSTTLPSYKQISAKGKLATKSTSSPTSTLTSSLPIFHYNQYSPSPQIAYTNDITEANELLSCLKGNILGFDLEWPPAGRYQVKQKDGTMKEQKIGMTYDTTAKKWIYGQGRTALMQFCDDKLIVLVHLGEKMDIPSKAVEILRSPSIYKLGVQVRGDGQKLVRDFPKHFTSPLPTSGSTSTSSPDIGPKGLLELSYLARSIDPLNTGPGVTLISLSALTRNYLEKELDKDKDIRKGNWFGVLDEKQRNYAANDVYASLQIYKALRRIAEENDFKVNLDKYLSLVGSTTSVKTSTTTSNGGSFFETQIQIGEKAIKVPEGIKPPKPAELSALNDFVSGQTIENIAIIKGIKLSTAEGYICSALQILGASALDEKDRKRLWDEIPKDTWTWKRNRELYKVLKKEFDPDAGSDSDTDVGIQA